MKMYINRLAVGVTVS